MDAAAPPRTLVGRGGCSPRKCPAPGGAGGDGRHGSDAPPAQAAALQCEVQVSDTA